MYKAINECHSDGPLVLQVCKQYPNKDLTEFHTLCSILSGTIRRNQQVHVLQSDGIVAQSCTVDKLWIY